MGYTVQKIYTYTYETAWQLGQSAFLSGCGENEVHILSLAEEGGEQKLEYRNVDYRYGFYDVAGDFLKIWETWSSPAGGEIRGDLYIDQILPSPDGRHLLVYICSAFSDRTRVCLYTLGVREPLVLYDGAGAVSGFFRGAFSPDSRWVTFDAAGVSTVSTRLVPIYDCTQTASRSTDTWIIEPGSGSSIPPAAASGGAAESAAGNWSTDDGSSRLLSPDQVLYAPELKNEKMALRLWDAGLYTSESGLGLISLIQEADSASLFLREDTFLPGKAIEPDISLIQGEYPEEKAPFQDLIQYSERYLLGYERLPFPICQVSADGATVHYLSLPLMLWTMDMAGIREETVRDFPNYVWDFLALPSGDILAALIKESRNDYAQDPDINTNQFTQVSSVPAALQEYWGILSADLYLYPAGSPEGHLLYKNLQNLIAMEYDEETGRILLETYTDQDQTRRRCILLEL